MAGQAAPPPLRSSSVGACPIPYPDRFFAARYLVDRLDPAAFGDDQRLLLYALSQQAQAGPNTAPAPRGWAAAAAVEHAKWQSWKHLGNMARLEAMRLYVKMLDEQQPEWWNSLPHGWEAAAAAEVAGAGGLHGAVSGSLAGGPDNASGGGGGGGGGGNGNALGLSELVKAGAWVTIPQAEGRRPAPRYEHGAALVGRRLWVLGGHCNGRYLDDLWFFDLEALHWRHAPRAPPSLAATPVSPGGQQQQQQHAPAAAAAALPASAGHSVTPWRGRLLVVGGHTRAKDAGAPAAVRLLDPVTLEWALLATTGPAPCARGGHSATLVGDTLCVFGGEDALSRPLADAHALDLETMAWSPLDAPAGADGGGDAAGASSGGSARGARAAAAAAAAQRPPPRAGHTAVAYDGHLVVFGGGTAAQCLGDTWALDLATRRWARPALARGAPPPAPRAGHAAALVGGEWYILGGGDNVRGCTDMLAADLSEIAAGRISWRRVAAVPAGSPLAAEGASLTYDAERGLLVAYGGYSGHYHGSVSVYKLPAGGGGGEGGAPADEQQQQQQELDSSQHLRQQQQQQHIDPQQQQDEQQQQQEQQPGTAAGSTGAAPSPAAGLSPASSSQRLANGGGAGGGSQRENLLKDLALQREKLKRDLAAAREEAAQANARAAAAEQGAEAVAAPLRCEVEELRGALAEARDATAGAARRLAEEQARVLRLEAAAAELQERLGAMHELERELEHHRAARQQQQLTESAAAAAAKRAGGSGIWGYISGEK